MLHAARHHFCQHFKRAIDLVGATAILIALSPLLLATAIAIGLSLSQPTRYTAGEHTVTLYVESSEDRRTFTVGTLPPDAKPNDDCADVKRQRPDRRKDQRAQRIDEGQDRPAVERELGGIRGPGRFYVESPGRRELM